MKSLLLAILVLLGANIATAKQPLLSEKQMASPPPRIIRTCCSFGSEMKLMGLPGLKITEIIGIADLGNHKYLGDKKTREGNGIIYTQNGGFIDIGHLRDQADWTAYLYNLILEIRDNRELLKEDFEKKNAPNNKANTFQIKVDKANGNFLKILGHEGGLKTLSLKIPEDITNKDAVQLAGKIAYDLSVWHEIATWYGASSIPFVPERFSSFSVEDGYSNLLGATLGIQAIESELPYEKAMTELILTTLENLDALATERESILAMEAVKDIWWTREKKLPSKNILLKRQLEVYPAVKPLLIENWATVFPDEYALKVPQLTKNGAFLSNYYELTFKLNQKVPFRKLFPNRKKRQITQADFSFIIKEIDKEIFLLEQKQLAISERKLVKAERKRSF